MKKNRQIAKILHTQKMLVGYYLVRNIKWVILKAILVLHLRIVLFGLGLNFRMYSKMCSSYHMKIMEKCLQDLVLYTPKT